MHVIVEVLINPMLLCCRFFYAWTFLTYLISLKFFAGVLLLLMGEENTFGYTHQYSLLYVYLALGLQTLRYQDSSFKWYIKSPDGIT